MHLYINLSVKYVFVSCNMLAIIIIYGNSIYIKTINVSECCYTSLILFRSHSFKYTMRLINVTKLVSYLSFYSFFQKQYFLCRYTKLYSFSFSLLVTFSVPTLFGQSVSNRLHDILSLFTLPIPSPFSLSLYLSVSISNILT